MHSPYSAEWVAAFNDAVADLEVTSVVKGPSIVAESGSFAVAYEITGTSPGDGDVRIVLSVIDGRVKMALDPNASSSVNVTVSVTQSDALALSLGELDAATALGRGAIRVKGDLSVLVAGQAVLSAASARMGGAPKNDIQ